MLRRREEFQPDLISFGDLTLNIQSGTLSCGGTEFILPKQEYRLMEQLMLNQNIFLSTEELLVKAWGYDAKTDINSVWLYISYIRKKAFGNEFGGGDRVKTKYWLSTGETGMKKTLRKKFILLPCLRLQFCWRC